MAIQKTLSTKEFLLPDITKLREPPGLRLPFNVEAEQQLLGSLLLRNAGYADVRGIVIADHFSELAHQRIFDALSELIEAGEPANPATMAYLFNTDPDVFSGGKPGRYLMRLAGCTVMCTNNRYLGIMIADLALRRGLMADLEDVRPRETAIDALKRHRDAIEAVKRARQTEARDVAAR